MPAAPAEPAPSGATVQAQGTLAQRPTAGARRGSGGRRSPWAAACLLPASAAMHASAAARALLAWKLGATCKGHRMLPLQPPRRRSTSSMCWPTRRLGRRWRLSWDTRLWRRRCAAAGRLLRLDLPARQGRRGGPRGAAAGAAPRVRCHAMQALPSAAARHGPPSPWQMGRLTKGLWLVWEYEGDKTLAYYLKRRCAAALAVCDACAALPPPCCPAALAACCPCCPCSVRSVCHPRCPCRPRCPF